MGKISDAIDKHKAEKQESKPVEHVFMPQRIKAEEPEVTFAKEYLQEQRYSEKLVTILAPDSVTAETFKVIRGTILYDKDRPAPKAIMVTSTFPGEGKTFVSSNLAVSFAMGMNENVLLIDADLRRPSIHDMFGYSNEYGLSEHLQGEKTIPELLIKTKIANLSLLLSGETPSNPVELLSSKKMGEFIKESKDRYQDRFIILDVPPSQLTAETNVIANHVDGIILVVKNGKTPRAVIQQTVENLGKEKILGIIFNGFAQSYKAYNKYYKKYYK
ncbi:MAG: polysaccharide biosynthesis tyrosine autokinase [Deltaproteobacteria bacterium]|nr:polysaccharide biosynthesis tyrosine autokinase [Deltaproteobacteria bacterium]